MTTIFYGLYQGDILDREGDATCVGVFSTEEKAKGFEKLLSEEHTRLKRESNEARERLKRNPYTQVPYVADLYWDIRPVAFDPRTIEELEAAE